MHWVQQTRYDHPTIHRIIPYNQLPPLIRYCLYRHKRTKSQKFVQGLLNIKMAYLIRYGIKANSCWFEKCLIKKGNVHEKVRVVDLLWYKFGILCDAVCLGIDTVIKRTYMKEYFEYMYMLHRLHILIYINILLIAK